MGYECLYIMFFHLSLLISIYFIDAGFPNSLLILIIVLPNVEKTLFGHKIN